MDTTGPASGRCALSPRPKDPGRSRNLIDELVAIHPCNAICINRRGDTTAMKMVLAAEPSGRS